MLENAADSGTKERDAKVAAEWDKRAQNAANIPTRWWQFPSIIRHINKRVCGDPVDGLSHGLLRRLQAHKPNVSWQRGVSVGCGAGQKEMELIRQGVVEHFDLYELAGLRLEQGRRRAERLGISDQVSWHHSDAFEDRSANRFDFVHWNNSLHHMYDVDDALAWSQHVLRSGGVFYMDDFVGSTRFQWSRSSLAAATMVRRLLPGRYLLDPRDPAKRLARVVRRPDPEKLAARDPSEAADSGRIIPSLRRHFPGAEIITTGGAIYHLALSDVLANLDEERDARLLGGLLWLDSAMARAGETHYAVALAFT